MHRRMPPASVGRQGTRFLALPGDEHLPCASHRTPAVKTGFSGFKPRDDTASQKFARVHRIRKARSQLPSRLPGLTRSACAHSPPDASLTSTTRWTPWRGTKFPATFPQDEDQGDDPDRAMDEVLPDVDETEGRSTTTIQVRDVGDT